MSLPVRPKLSLATTQKNAWKGSLALTMRTDTPIRISDTAEAPRGLVPWGADISDDPTKYAEEGTSILLKV